MLLYILGALCLGLGEGVLLGGCRAMFLVARVSFLCLIGDGRYCFRFPSSSIAGNYLFRPERPSPHSATDTLPLLVLC